MKWAFEEYATGRWTIRSLRDELTDKGLTTVSGPRTPAKPLNTSHLHRLLQHPFYKGVVRYRGVEYQGSHTALVSEQMWSRVQDVLKSKGHSGEKQRQHHHYLKGSVYCAKCGSRLIITITTNRHNKEYRYFVCLGRHQHRTPCDQKAVFISAVEAGVEDHYGDIEPSTTLVDGLKETIRGEMESLQQLAEHEKRIQHRRASVLRSEQAKLLHAHRMAEFTARSLNRALTAMGPTQLNIPRDFFHGDIDTEIPGPLVPERGAGGDSALSAATNLLEKAEFPVIISGGGVIMGDSVNDCVALAEHLGAPVVNSYLHNDSFPASHPLWCGPLGYQGSKAAMELISKADVVLALGTRLGPFGTLPQHGIDYWPKAAAVIQVDADPEMLGLVKPVSVGISGDAGAAARDLLTRLKNRTLASSANREKRLEVILDVKASWASELDAWTHEIDHYSEMVIKEAEAEEGDWLHPRQVLRALENSLPDDVIVSTDIGNINSVANSYLRFDKPRSFLAPMSWGNCGYSLPTAIGAKAAAPDRPIVAYAGDGAWTMSMVEMMTAVRHKLPVTAVVFNNRQWGAEKKNQVDFYGERFVAADLENFDLAQIARSMGAQGVVVDDLDQVGPALDAAIKAQMESDVTTVLEIRCTRELGDPFRRDALSKPVRYVPKYQDYI